VIFGILGDIALAIHFLWIVFLTIGFLLTLYFNVRIVRLFHVWSLFATFGMQILGIYCPLTYVEEYLKRKSDPTFSYGGSFVRTHLEKLVYVDVSPNLIMTLTAIFLLAVIVSFWVRPLGKR
jgi:hypothetical protein